MGKGCGQHGRVCWRERRLNGANWNGQMVGLGGLKFTLRLYLVTSAFLSA